MIIRKAVNGDIDDILRLYKAGLRELGEKYKESLVLDKVLKSFTLAPCFLSVVDDKIVGMVGLTLSITSHNGVASLADYMFYVEPEHRNIKTLDALMNKVKDFAVSHKLPVRLDFFTKRDEGAKKRLFSRYGFEVKGVMGVYYG